MNSSTRIALAVTAALGSALSFALASETKMPLGEAPAAVQAAVKQVVGTAEVSKFTKEVEDGKTSYEAEFKVGDVEHSATIAEDGKVLEEEQDVAPADLPAAVSAAIAKAAPTGKLGDASIVKADGKTYYEADVKVGEEKHEIKVATDGTVISNKVEKDEDEDGDKDEGKSDEHKK